VEIAARKGIVVVASSGNDGTTKTDLAFPARNPDVIAVGAADLQGSTNSADWAVADFADRGTTERAVDLIAPGVDVQGLRVPGSVIDSLAPSATNDPFERGSGTSQAAAVVAGLAAQLAQRYPTATPAQIKGMLQGSTTKVKSGRSWSQGGGEIVAGRLLSAAPTAAPTPALATTGTAPIESDRVDATLALDGVALTGELDVQGNTWSSAAWAAAATAGTSWQGGRWMGHRWTGDKFGPKGWASATWASSWSGQPFTAAGGPGGTWDGLRWNGLRWNGTSWTGLRWNGLRWNGAAWEGLRWNGLRWNFLRLR
jgi:serine protease AprX